MPHANTKHGMARTDIYEVWHGMIQRCTNPNTYNWSNYGGRGITVCREWFEFTNFYRDMGPRPKGMSIERIDNNAGYTPENCRWLPTDQQSRNRRVVKKIIYDGKEYVAIEIGRAHGLTETSVRQRIREGWDPLVAAIWPRTRVRGAKQHKAKLTEDKVLEIRKSHQQGELASTLARRFGVSDSSLRKVLKRQSWKHVP